MRWSWKYNGNDRPENDRPELVERKELSIDRRLEEMNHEIAHLREQLDSANRARIATAKKLETLQSALRPLVLRLKVLDIDAMVEKEGDGGLVPLRFAISDLKALVAAWDGKLGLDAYQPGIQQPGGGSYQIPDNTTVASPYITWTGTNTKF